MTKPKPKPDDPEQFARFLEAAKKAEVDPARFEKAVEMIIPPKRPPGPSPQE